MITEEQFEFLKREVTKWEEQTLLEGGQGRAILAAYAVRSRRERVLNAFSIIGTGITAIGVLLFIAANSQSVGPLFKVLLLSIMMISSYVLAWRMRENERAYQTYGEALTLLGCLLFGAMTIVIGQFFQVNGLHWSETLLWGLGIFPVAMAFRSQYCAILSASVLAFSACTCGSPFSFEWCLATLGAFVVSYVTTSPLSLLITLCAALFKIFVGEFHVVPFTILGVSFFLLHLIHKENFQLEKLAWPFFLVSVSMLEFGFAFLLCWAHYGGSLQPSLSFWALQTVTGFAVACLLLSIVTKVSRNYITLITGILTLGLFCIGLIQISVGQQEARNFCEHLNWFLGHSGITFAGAELTKFVMPNEMGIHGSMAASIFAHVIFVLLCLALTAYAASKTDNRLFITLPCLGLLGFASYIISCNPFGSTYMAPLCFVFGALILSLATFIARRISQQGDMRIKRTVSIPQT